MKRRLRIIITMIVLALLLSNFISANTNNTKHYESSCRWETYNDNPDLFSKLSGLPYGTTPTAKNRPFNYRIWFGKGIVVYGTPEQANVENGIRINYKEDTRNPNGIGFYKKPGKKRGEYRYDGYTIDGNLYANTNFPYDGNCALSLEERPWIYHYWDSDYVTKQFKGEQEMKISQYTKAAVDGRTYLDKKTREWINNGMTAFKIKNGVMDTGVNDKAPGQKPDGTWDFHNFINIQSAPSAKFNGEGRMFRLTPSRGLWYMVFTINKYQKEHTPVEVAVRVINEDDLGFIDYGKDNPAGFETQTLDVKVEVTARLKDEEHMKDPIARAVYYTREDRSCWTVSLDGREAGVNDIQIYDNIAKTIFTVTMTKAQIKALKGSAKGFSAAARCIYFDGRFDEGSNLGRASFSISVLETEKEIPFLMEPKCVIPQIGFDIIRFDAADNTEMEGISSRKVYINGIEVDDESFFSGNYIFGIGEDGLKKIDVYYTDKEGKEAFHTAWAYIYSTKPNAQFSISGTFKQNRKLTVTDNSGICNVKPVTDACPITSYSWKVRPVSGDSSSIRLQDINSTTKNLLFKKPGSYEVELTVANSIGRVSDPYIFTFEIFPDYQPALEIDLDNSVISRIEAVNAWNYNASSTDNDKISRNTIELWYDSNNDGKYDRLIKTYDGSNGFPVFKPEGLGRYKFINTIEESFGEETIKEFITAADKVSRTVEREILVDNLQPMAGLYVEIPVSRPQIDTFIMLDPNLENSKVKYIRDNRLELSNYLRSANVQSDVEVWDMHTYTYTQSASTAVHSGAAYPSGTVEYASNGYFGVLNRTSVSNNSYQTDEGGYEPKIESKTVKGTQSGWAENVYEYTSIGWEQISSSKSNQPTMEYDEDGFKGTLTKVGFTEDSDTGYPSGKAQIGAIYTRRRTYTGYYSGTVSRTVSAWVPRMVWHDDYTGYYSGSIKKDVRQPYTDPFRPTSIKYVIYITDGDINGMPDLKSVLSKADARLILISPASVKNQISAQYYITNSRPIDQTVREALDSMSNGSTAEEYYVFAGSDSIKLNVSDFDEENDRLTDKKLLYVQDTDYFDNGCGREAFAVEKYSDKSGWVDTLVNKINKPGKYTIYRRVRDVPSADPAFSSFSRYSGTPFINIYVHRKPLALAALDWDFDPADNTYRTTWVDNSYDPDHQYNRSDKGIVERKIMYRQAGGEFYYKIPDKLKPGIYELHYFVKDPEGAWSDPFVQNFTLDPAPSIQLKASLRTLDNRFSLADIPASESLEAFELWTRFPYDVNLEMALYRGNTRVTPVRKINFSGMAGVKSGNDIQWNNVVYQIPAVLPDRSYEFRITAVDSQNRTAAKSFTVNVSTPLNLEPAMPSQVTGGTAADVTAQTSKYAGTVSATLFQGTAYQRTYNLTAAGSGGGGAAGAAGSGGTGAGTAGSTVRNWTGSLTIPENVPDGDYVARFTAIALNGSSQSRDIAFRLTNLSISNVSINGYWNHWRGQTDIFGKRMTNEPHRFLSLECLKISVTTVGNPERVTVRFSPELEAMTYTDPNGQSYDYEKDYFGYRVDFPADATFPTAGNHVYWEYHLPLAPSTKDWNNNRLRQPYKMTVTACKGSNMAQYVIDDIDITGNIYDLTYIQPKE